MGNLGKLLMPTLRHCFYTYSVLPFTIFCKSFVEIGSSIVWYLGETFTAQQGSPSHITPDAAKPKVGDRNTISFSEIPNTSSV